jgi:ATP-dependent exoDNAse (exonuclease V) beta subunit
MPDLNAGHEGPRGPLLISDAWGLACKLQTEGEDNDEGDGEEEDAHTERADEQVSSAWRLARLEEKTASAAEDTRKFYVAATRHKDRLILVGADWRTKTGTLRASRSFIAEMDRVLGISAALEAGADRISYGSPFSARLVRQIACADEHEPGRQGKAAKVLASATAGDELVSAIAADGAAGGSAGELPLIGPIPATTGNARLAVTALCDFAHCPMLYRWRHELRAPAPARESARPVDGQGGVGPAEMGTLFHRCMELLDFDRPQAARSLVTRVAAEMDMDETLDADAATGDLEAMLDLFRRGDLFGRISSAKTVLRELAFVIRTSAGTLNGQIDLAFEDAGGAWRIVDYKSDRVTATELAGRAERYRLQMMVYALALADHLGAAPAGASLWFLRPGASHAFDVDADSLAAARREIDALAEALLGARRTGSFDGIDASQCDGCPYGPLCGRSGPASG